MTPHSDGDLLKLAPCPFCGVMPLLTRVRESFFTIHCGNEECAAGCEVSSVEHMDAIKNWNTRHSASASTAGRGEVVADLVREWLERAALIAEAIDSGRGNEKEIARAIRDLAKRGYWVGPADTSASVVGDVQKALAFNTESDAIDNLEGALIDIKRLSEQGKPTDAVCIRTLERIMAQLVTVHAALTSQGKTDAGSDPFVAAAIAEDAKWPDPILGAAQAAGNPDLARRVVEFIDKNDPFGDEFCRNDTKRIESAVAFAQGSTVPTLNEQIIHGAVARGHAQYWADSRRQEEAFKEWESAGYEGDCRQCSNGSVVDYITRAIMSLSGPAKKMLEEASSITSTASRTFYGAECPSYPNCSGGCGLGCTKKIESAKAVSAIPSTQCAWPNCEQPSGHDYCYGHCLADRGVAHTSTNHSGEAC
jgi:hypothetical protein